MSVSTNAQICFGILFDEDFEFPWKDDLDEWWLKECEYEPLFKLYDDKGDYLNGVKPPAEDINRYYDHRFEFRQKYPLPIQEVNVCSSEYPQYILAVPSSVIVANRGYPQVIDPYSMVMTTPMPGIVPFKQFVRKYFPGQGEPVWYLSSYYGC